MVFPTCKSTLQRRKVARKACKGGVQRRNVRFGSGNVPSGAGIVISEAAAALSDAGNFISRAAKGMSGAETFISGTAKRVSTLEFPFRDPQRHRLTQESVIPDPQRVCPALETPFAAHFNQFHSRDFRSNQYSAAGCARGFNRSSVSASMRTFIAATFEVT